MIQASELRIGNYVFDDEGILSKINGMQPYGYSIRCDEEEGCELLIDLYPQDGTIKKGFAVDINLCNPIPLTEEWLEKFGFKEYKDFGYKTNQFDLIPLQGFSYNLASKKVRIMQTGNSNSHWLKNEVQYVHTLQNLYFALTAEELKLKNND